MKNTSKKADAKSFGPAGMSMKLNGRDIEIGCGVLMTGENVEEFKLEITGLETHNCIIDGENAYRTEINEFGEIKRIPADLEKMKKIAETRKEQGREVEVNEQAR